MTIIMTIVMTIGDSMKHATIKASEFKAKCLQLMDEVNISGEEIVITKNGIPVSRLVPFREKPPTLFAAHKNKITITGDIISPTGENWEVLD